MPKSRTIGLLGTAVACLLGYGCGDTVTPSFESTMPFDPSGSWEAQVQGLLRGSQVDAAMVITLSIYGSYTSPTGGPIQLELTGSWQWGGFAGTIAGFWTPADDAAARDSGGGCPRYPGACSLTLSLEEPSDSCTATGGGYPSYMSLLGWFDGPMTMVGARLKGTYWEGEGVYAHTCPGPVLLSLDTDVSFARN